MDETAKSLQLGYFELLVRFATRAARLQRISLEEALFTHTCLYRRFGCARPERVSDPQWRRFLDGLAAAADSAAYAYAFYRSAPPGLPPARRFGCFSFNPPDPDGVVRIHFTNAEAADIAPLGEARARVRRHELASMFAYIREHHPDARVIRGESWLYNLQAYTRLFPDVYGRSRTRREAQRFQGYSRWGQFLDRCGATRVGPARQFVARLETVSAGNLGDAFPMPAYRCEAAIEEFERFYATSALA